ncbi:MAG: hypothetical protein FWD82_05870 [Defluviitaleaceae bacterium]|nr:hypothetical protein [Defluviitaleaceae bacterium]
MARYKETEKGRGLFLTINLSEQIIKGTYKYTLTHLIDKKLDLSIFDDKYNSDLTEAAAIEPRILLKIILYLLLNGCDNLPQDSKNVRNKHDSKSIGRRCRASLYNNIKLCIRNEWRDRKSIQ